MMLCTRFSSDSFLHFFRFGRFVSISTTTTVSSRILFSHLLILILILVPSPSTLVSSSAPASSTGEEEVWDIDPYDVKNWALIFGKDIYEGSAEATCLRTIEENYNEMKVKVDFVDPPKILDYFITDVQNMFKWKREHVERIATKAEAEAANHTYEPHIVAHADLNAKRLYDQRLEDKVTAVQRSLPYFNRLSESEKNREMNRWDDLVLSSNPGYNNIPVNLERSVVHIPTNLQEDKPSVLNSIKWSASLTPIFKNNKNHDFDLSWQFFCSNEGFMRLFPAAAWRIPKVKRVDSDDTTPLDLYDCRLRNWYIKAAASPKDILILIDRGSRVSGDKREILRSLANNILDTLTDDDFGLVLSFAHNVTPIVDCFGTKLVQANKQNLRAFKEYLHISSVKQTSDFKSALLEAFEILQQANRTKLGAQCNQAIMVLTAGDPGDYESIFEQYKGPFEQYNYPRIPIRVFTYLAGKEASSTSESEMMSCRGRGYYTQVSNMQQVREKVQLYVPVLSRPIVLSGNRPFVYTPVYTDNTDVPLDNWVWDRRERQSIRKSVHRRMRRGISSKESQAIEAKSKSKPSEKESQHLKKTAKGKTKRMDSEGQSWEPQMVSDETGTQTQLGSQIRQTDEKRRTKDPNLIQIEEERKRLEDGQSWPSFDAQKALPFLDKKPKRVYQDLLMTIAAPVFDTKHRKNLIEDHSDGNQWRHRASQSRSAQLLGVAGVDVPIRQILRYTPAYKLGVNGYSFAINNNGYVLYHPNLRPLHQELIKPYYSSVDLLEVELVNNQKPPREIDPNVNEMRTTMLQRLIGWKKYEVKMHLDSMRRVVTRTNTYYHGPIKDSPFVLGISLPEPYGHYRIVGQIEVKIGGANHSHYFKGNNWRVHPNWVYCNDDSQNFVRGVTYKTPEEGILLVLDKLSKASSFIRWQASSLNPQKSQGRNLICDKDLLQSLVFDAKATNIDAKKCGTPKMPAKYEREITKMYGISLSFVATRSGLTRFEDHRTEEEKNATSGGTDQQEETTFGDVYNRATDELFYQRAVDFYRFNASAFVFSVPFDAGSKEDKYIIGSHALFFGSGTKKAPAAVAGIVFKHKMFTERFFNFSTMCMKSNCKLNCSSPKTDCFLLDNNGYVIVSETNTDTGRFFGEIDWKMFDTMVGIGVYKEIQMFDYQAICRQAVKESSPASILRTPFRTIGNFLLWLWFKITLISVDFYLKTIALLDGTSGEYHIGYDPSSGLYPDEEKVTNLPPNKTRPYPCDKKFNLYEMERLSGEDPKTGYYPKCDICDERYILQPVPYTNLILLVLQAECPCAAQTHKIVPQEIMYEGDCAIERHHIDRIRAQPNVTCRNHHPEEPELKACGKGIRTVPSKCRTWLWILLSALINTLMLHCISISHSA